MSPKANLDLTTGSVYKKLIAFSVPYILGTLLQQIYSFIGVFIVSRFSANGAQALAAVGATSSITSLLIGFFTGLSLGSNVLCSNYIGAKNQPELRRTMNSSLSVSVLCGFIVILLGLLFSRSVLTVMNVPDTVIDAADLYLRLYLLGAPFSLLYNTCAAIMRAHGDTKRPMTILTLSGVVNVLLSVVLIVFLELGVAGVALSTVASQAFSAGCTIYILFSKKDQYRLRFREITFQPRVVLAILRIGIPSGFNTIIFYFASIVLQSTLNTFGDTAMAGQSAANSITVLLHTIPNGFYATCTSFAGQCYGAGDYKRIDKMAAASLCISMSTSTILAVAVTLLRTPLIGIFNSDPAIIRAGIPYLLILAWGYVLYAIPSTFMGCLQGMRRSTINAVSNLMCICFARILWIFCIFPIKPTITVLNLCYPASFVISGAALFLLYRYIRKHL